MNELRRLEIDVCCVRLMGMCESRFVDRDRKTQAAHENGKKNNAFILSVH